MFFEVRPCSSSINPSTLSSTFISSSSSTSRCALSLSLPPSIHPLIHWLLLHVASIITTAPCWASSASPSSSSSERGSTRRRGRREMAGRGQRWRGWGGWEGEEDGEGEEDERGDGDVESRGREESLGPEWLVCQQERLRRPWLGWAGAVWTHAQAERERVCVCKRCCSPWFIAGRLRVKSCTHPDAQHSVYSSMTHWFQSSYSSFPLQFIVYF